jgi:hypothetical protein
MSRRGRPGIVGRRLRQDLEEVDFGRLRFRLRGGPARERLQDSGRAFLEGFNETVAGPGGDRLTGALEAIPEEFRGFAYEGAGMGCAMLDLMTLSGGRRLRTLMDGPGKAYPHLIHVGAGWAFARLRLRPWKALRAGDPLLRWLAYDGFGFHQGFFHADRVVGRQRVESGLAGVRRQVRDQGLGRALWFHECADPEGVALRIAEFPASRHPDLWSGIGLAATYAGGCTVEEMAALAEFAAASVPADSPDRDSGKFPPNRAHLAQGAAFAAAARLRSGLPLPAHVLAGARILTGAEAPIAAAWTDAALPEPGTRPGGAAYQAWRAGIRQHWARQTGHPVPPPPSGPPAQHSPDDVQTRSMTCH